MERFLALCPGDAKQNLVVYGAQFGVVFQAKGNVMQKKTKQCALPATKSKNILVLNSYLAGRLGSSEVPCNL